MKKINYQSIFETVQPEVVQAAPESYREKQAKLMEKKRRTAQDIGDIPLIVNPARRESCRNDLRLYLQTYHAHTFYRDFSPAHLSSIQKTQNIILHGGVYAEAMPRGTGKTTLSEGAIAWAVVYGHRKFIVDVVESGADVEQARNAIKTEFETNELLLEDFPEICFPVRALDGNAARANGQRCNGRRTYSAWGTNRIIFPTIPGSMASGTVFVMVTIERVRRGMKHKPADGGAPRRPDLVLIDDPQNDESAASDMQNNKREKIVSGTILGLAGQDKKIACKMACTIIKENDLADRFLSRDKHPEWQGEKHSLIIKWPVNMDIWEQYRNIYLSELENQSGAVDQEHNTPKSNEFYSANRPAMDAGLEVMWPGFHFENELSDFQHVMNKFFRMGADSFACECQNQPIKKNTELHSLNVPMIMGKTSGFRRGNIPPDCPFVVCCCDINYYAISWAVVAFRNDYAGYIVDYGFYPGNAPLYVAGVETNEETAIYEGLVKFTAIMAQKYPNIQIMGIDGNRFTSPVYKFVFNYQHKLPFRLVPIRGHAAKHYREPMPDNKELIGKSRLRCHMMTASKYNNVPHALYDSYYWHLFMQRMWLLSPGSPKSVSIFGDITDNHRIFAEQICAERLTDMYERHGELIYEWTTSGKNEMSDVLTMAAVVGNLAGLEPDNVRVFRPQQRKSIQVQNFNR